MKEKFRFALAFLMCGLAIGCSTKETVKEEEVVKTNGEISREQVEPILPVEREGVRVQEEWAEGKTEKVETIVTTQVALSEFSKVAVPDRATNTGQRSIPSPEGPNSTPIGRNDVGFSTMKGGLLEQRWMPQVAPPGSIAENGNVSVSNVWSYPTELYAGENVVTFWGSMGIHRVEPVFDSLTKSLTEVVSLKVDTPNNCSDSVIVRIKVNTATTSLNLRFRAFDCLGKSRVVTLNNRTWRVDEVPFPDVMVGDTVCRPFQIGLQGVLGTSDGAYTEYLDSISVTAPGAFPRFMHQPPQKLGTGSTYRYEVCFAPTEPGLYRFPVITWMRRQQPAGGYTNYQVADTAVVRALKFKQY